MHFSAVSLIWLACLTSSSAIPTLVKNNMVSTRSDSPNPIASLYPNNVTGTINSTIALVPISYGLARSIIPSQYGILKKAYEALLPGFPRDKYPLVVRSGLDHAVGLYSINFSVPDFQKIQINYPFVDLLGDGYSSFTYSLYLPVTSTNLIAQAGAVSYGQIPIPATFNPPDEAYGFKDAYGRSKEIFLDAYTNLSSTQPSITTKFNPTWDVAPWPLRFYVNVTNQPTFTDGLSCDNQLNLFNTTLSTGKNVPVGVKGDVMIKAPYIPSDTTFRDVYGVKVDIAFIENNQIPCENLKGYSGTGPGD